jgi:hypothetical protein
MIGRITGQDDLQVRAGAPVVNRGTVIRIVVIRRDGPVGAGHGPGDEGCVLMGIVRLVKAALRQLPAPIQERLTALSPMTYLKNIHAPLIVLLHDRGDPVIPVSESEQLFSALKERAGVQYTELLFQHLDPLKGKLSPFRLAQQLGKFYKAVYPMFRQVA